MANIENGMTEPTLPKTAVPAGSPEPEKVVPPLVTASFVVENKDKSVKLNFGNLYRDRGQKVGEPYVSIEDVGEGKSNSAESLLQWLGVTALTQIATDYVRKVSMSLTASCTKDSVFDQKKFAKLLPILIASTESNKALREQNQALMVEAFKNDISAGDPAALSNVQRVFAQIQDNNAVIEAREQAA